jgi:hypothetical protein
VEPTPTQVTMFGRDLHDPAQRAEVERALESVVGMVAARVVPGFDRPVDELHALVNGDRGPKQVVRDIQSLLYTRFDLSIDHRVISVVQLTDDDPIVNLEAAEARRPVLTRLSVTQTGDECSVTVVVTDPDGVEHVGGATADVAPTRHQHTAAAQATLQALDDLVPQGTGLSLHAVDLVQCAGVQVALAVVDVRSPRSRATLTGSAAVRRGDIDAIARAALDAVNRILQGD